MIIINNSNGTKYSTLAHRDLMPGARSADIDAAGLAKALGDVVKSCGRIFSIRMSSAERSLIDALLTLDEVGRATKIAVHPKVRSMHDMVMRRDAEEKSRRAASIRASQAREESIRNEANYTSKNDVQEAKNKSMSLKGSVEAKKLNTKLGGEVSLNDLMGDNKFIEESMKHSGIATAMASEEGWDMEKMNAPKVKGAEAEETHSEAGPQEAPGGEPEPEAGKTTATTRKTKKSSRRRKENE